jgi:ParB family transcriptional regulator, chromosome partitioning protein
VARPSGLGRGLGALIPSAGDVGASPQMTAGTSLVELPIAAIRPNTYQPREEFDDDALESLAESIRELGVLQPILVRAISETDYELIAGERRWRAARRAGLTTVPALIRRVEDRVSLEQALVENLQRQDLNALEEAVALQQLIDDFSLTHEDVAKRVGKSRAAVTNSLRLLALSPNLQRMVRDGRLSASHARALLTITDKSYQESLAKRVVTEELSVRQTEEAARARQPNAAVRTGSPSAKAKGADRPAGLIELEVLLAEHLQTKVAIDLPPAGSGKISVQVADLSDLERVFRIMTTGFAADEDIDPEDELADS